MQHSRLFGILAAAAMGSLATSRDASAEPPLSYNRDIRSILSNNCFPCHGPDGNKRQAKLRLDVREEAIGRKAIVPGKPEESKLVARVFAEKAEDVMPPAESHKTLDAAQKEKLRRWVAEGAAYQAHWAYVPITRPELPATKRTDWPRNPIDRFILSALEASGVEPSREADKRRLFRRLSLDLIGLPPSADEVEAFIADGDANAYERRVDQLLDSPHYGERMAAPWLDLVRFADTVGYHGDQGHRIYPYRDYVIDAFNKNLPFDQFTIEQLAGDLLPAPTTQQLVATGFNRLNMMTREGGAQPKEYLAKYASDRVRTVSLTWLGSTMGCCECHDHKYDPFLSKDFYSLAAFFADVKQWGVYQDYSYTPNPELRGWSNDHPFPPEIEVDSPYLARRKAALEARLLAVAADAEKKAAGEAGHEASLEAWREASAPLLSRAPSGWLAPGVENAAGGEAAEDGSILFAGEAKGGEERKLVLAPFAGWVAAIRVEAIPHAKNGGQVARGGAQSASIRVAASVQKPDGGDAKALSFFFADADSKEPSYFNGDEIPGVLQGWRTSAARPKERQASIWYLESPVRVAEGERLAVTLRGDNLGCVRVSISPFLLDDPRSPEAGDELKAAFAVPGSSRTKEQAALIRAQYLLGTAWDAAAHAEAKSLLQQIFECGNGRAFTMVTKSMDPLPTRVLRRGNWQDESGSLVDPAVPAFLPQPRDAGSRRLTRLDLASWIVSRENPLAARVLANRLWKLYFGAGLSASVDDLGAQGEAPSHPELLDWLACELRDGGWNVKRLVKTIVMSAAYRQDSNLRSELRDADPQNRLLSSQNPRRLEAELVRDNALSIAGLLNLDVGGPSARPYQPAGYYANLQFPDRDYVAQRDDRQYRRGVYVHWQRTFLHPMMANFDAPPREDCTPVRVVSNTPQQALTLLNDPTFVEAARSFAQHLLEAPGLSDEERLDRAFLRALSRPIAGKERTALVAFLGQQRAYYESHKEDAVKLEHEGLLPAPAENITEVAAWTQTCRVLLNLHESITRY